ncbi:MAG: amidase [Elusimicrobiota bacterium]
MENCHLARLAELFAELEPAIKAFLPEPKRFARLRRELAALESRYPDPAARPPLYGIPVGVKDIFHVDGFTTRAGARVPADLLQGEQARSVTLLKEAGALVLGKTVTTEFAYFATGPTRNPHNTEHTPGGSSSGSAAAVGAGLCPLALGTQTIGSIMRPAAYCGTFGFKPTSGRIPLDGVIPLSPSADHIGFFAADAAWAKLAAAALCRDWENDERIAESAPLVLGVPEGDYMERASARALRHFADACFRLKDAGAKLKTLDLLPDFAAISARHDDLVAAEAASVHREWFAGHAALYHDKTAELIRRGQTIEGARLAECRAGRGALRARLADALERHGLSAVIAPAATGPAPEGLASSGDPIMNLPWTHAGLPVAGVPSGMLDGLPMGVQLIGGWMRDEALLRLAAKVETVLKNG